MLNVGIKLDISLRKLVAKFPSRTHKVSVNVPYRSATNFTCKSILYVASIKAISTIHSVTCYPLKDGLIRKDIIVRTEFGTPTSFMRHI